MAPSSQGDLCNQLCEIAKSLKPAKLIFHKLLIFLRYDQGFGLSLPRFLRARSIDPIINSIFVKLRFEVLSRALRQLATFTVTSVQSVGQPDRNPRRN
jgi:hypothetical protein